MILNELAQSNTLLLITAKDLMEFGRQLITQAKLVVEMENEGEKMLTVEDVCKELKVCKSTLDRWQKAGYLEPVYMGKKRVYRASDIEELKKK